MFLLVCRAAKDSKLILLCHFHKKVFQKKTVISEKRNFFGQSLFLSHGKPGLYTSRLYFFFFENHELQSGRYDAKKSNNASDKLILCRLVLWEREMLKLFTGYSEFTCGTNPEEN